MHRRSALVSAAASAALVLAVAGCKIQVPSAAQASTGSPGQAAASGPRGRPGLRARPGPAR